MPDVTITYNDRTIVDLSDTGTRILKTHGTFCKNDFVVQYNKPSGGSDILYNQILSFPQGIVQSSNYILGELYMPSQPTGLGWSARYDAVCKSTSSMGTINGRNYYKTNNVAAVVAFCRNGSYWQPHTASTDSSACSYRATSGGPWNYDHSYTIDGITWYFFSGQHGFNDHPSIYTNFPVIDESFLFDTQANAERFLELMEVTMDE